MTPSPQMTPSAQSLKTKAGLISTWTYVLIGLFVYFYTKELFGISDFQIFYDAAEQYRLGNNMYKIKYQGGLSYFYSPLFAFCLAPFTYIDSQIVGWVWKFVNLLLLYRIWRHICSSFDLDFMKATWEKRTFTLTVFFFTIYTIYANLHNHQMTIFLVWAIFECMHQHAKGNTLRGAALLALAINFKIIPLVMLFYFVYRGEFKLSLWILLFCVVYLFLPAAYSGWDTNKALLVDWWEFLNPLASRHQLDVEERGLASLTTLLAVYLIENSSQWDTNYSYTRNFASLSHSEVIWITNIIRAGLVVSFLYFLRTLPFKKEPNPLKAFWEISYLLLITFLVFPRQNHYAFFLAFPAIFYLCYYLFHERQSMRVTTWWFLMGYLFVVTFMINSSFLIGNYRDLIRYFKVNTVGLLLLTPLLFVLKPDRLIKKHTQKNR